MLGIFSDHISIFHCIYRKQGTLKEPWIPVVVVEVVVLADVFDVAVSLVVGFAEDVNEFVKNVVGQYYNEYNCV